MVLTTITPWLMLLIIGPLASSPLLNKLWQNLVSENKELTDSLLLEAPGGNAEYMREGPACSTTEPSAAEPLKSIPNVHSPSNEWWAQNMGDAKRRQQWLESVTSAEKIRNLSSSPPQELDEILDGIHTAYNKNDKEMTLNNLEMAYQTIRSSERHLRDHAHFLNFVKVVTKLTQYGENSFSKLKPLSQVIQQRVYGMITVFYSEFQFVGGPREDNLRDLCGELLMHWNAMLNSR